MADLQHGLFLPCPRTASFRAQRWRQVNQGPGALAMPQVEFKVGMTCQGCANAVTRILSKLEGVSDVATDVEGKKVTANSSGATSPEDMLAALKKWGDASGKSVELVSS